MLDDHHLREFAKSRSDEAFRALVGRYGGLVTATCRRELRDEALAQDAAQSVFILLAERAPRLVGHRNLAAWLFRAAILTSRSLARKESRRKQAEQNAMNEFAQTTSTAATWKSVEPLLNQGIATLRADEQSVVLLRFVQGMTFPEVASTLGIGEDAARMRVNRSLERLRKFFGRHGVTLSVAALTAMLSQEAAAKVTTAELTALASAPSVSTASTLIAPKVGLILAGASALIACVVGTGFLWQRGTSAEVPVAARASAGAFDDTTWARAFARLEGTYVGRFDGYGMWGMDHSEANARIVIRPDAKRRLLYSFANLTWGQNGKAQQFERLSYDINRRKVVIGDKQEAEVIGLSDFAYGRSPNLVFVARTQMKGRVQETRVTITRKGEEFERRDEVKTEGEGKARLQQLLRAKREGAK